MFNPIGKNLFRWGTPDPAYDWMMYGHVIFRKNAIVLVDPPIVPGLVQHLGRMGKTVSIVLTTLDHSRGSAYLAEKTGTKLFVTDQTENEVDSASMRLLEQVKDYEKYADGEVAGLTAFNLKTDGNHRIGMPSMNEFALCTQ